MPYLILFLFVIALIMLFKCVRIVPQAQEYVIEFLGSYSKTLGNGLHLLIPIVERVANKVSLKEQVEDFPPQPVITKDNVTMQVDTVVYFLVSDAKLYTYGTQNPLVALANLTATTLRNISGELELDEMLTSRDLINNRMRQVLDEATDQWGIKVTRVELKNIIPPRDIQETMEKQLRAERERRKTLLEAEAHREAAVKRAEGDKAAMILRAEAERDSAIAKATGRAESLRLVYEAEAQGLERLASAQISENVIVLKRLEALKALGDGRATKLVVPTELVGSASQLSFIGDVLNITRDVDTSPKSAPEAEVADDCCDDEGRSDVTKGLSSGGSSPTEAAEAPEAPQRPKIDPATMPTRPRINSQGQEGGFTQRK